MNDIIIIGSGITGMSAALLLAKQNPEQSIRIVEAANKPAPLLWGFQRKSLHFDTGFHCGGGLRKGGILRNWLKALDVWKYIGEENLYPFREEFRFNGEAKAYHFPPTEKDLLPSIQEQFGQEQADSFATLYAKMLEVLEKSPYTNNACSRLPELSFENSQSLDDTLQNFPLSPYLQQMIKSRCLLYGVSPDKATFHDYALVGGLYFDSSHGIYDGGKALAKAFLQAIKDTPNITLQCKSAVTKITQKDKKISAVTLHSGEELPCTACIFTGHPSQLSHLVDKGVFRPSFMQYLTEIEETASAFLLFGESEHPYLEERAVYLLPSDPTSSLFSPLENDDPIIYVVGGKNLEHKKDIADKLQGIIKKRVPELGHISIHDTATAASMKDWIYGSSGSIYGMAHTSTGMPLLPVTRLQGLFLAGQNILLPGILGGIISAAVSVGFITDHAQVLKGFRECKD